VLESNYGKITVSGLIGQYENRRDSRSEIFLFPADILLTGCVFYRYYREWSISDGENL